MNYKTTILSFALLIASATYASEDTPFKVGEISTKKVPSGTDEVTKCMAMYKKAAQKDWSKLLTNKKDFDKATEKVYEKFANHSHASWNDSSKHQDIEVFAEDFHIVMQECAGFYGVMSSIDGYIHEEGEVEEYFDEYDGKEKVSSALGRFHCKRDGVQTLDFKACKNLARAIDGAIIVEKGTEISQQFQFQDKTLDAQEDLASRQTITGTEVLEAQKSSVEIRADLAQQRGALSTASAGVILGFYQALPDRDDIIEICEAKIKGSNKTLNDLFKSTVNSINCAECDSFKKQLVNKIIQKNTDTEKSSNICKRALRESKALKNENAKIAAEAFLVKKGIDIANAMLEKNLLDKQASQIDGAIQKIDAFAPPEFQFEQQLATASECEVNPEAQGCAELEAQRAVGFQSGDIIIGSGARNGTISSSGDGLGDTDIVGGGDASSSNGDDPFITDSLGNINNPDRPGNEFEDGPLAAGALGKGTAGPGAASGVSPGGASTGAARPLADEGSRGQQIKAATGGSQVTFGKGSASSGPTFRSGNTSSKRASKGNPFANLLGKKKGKKSKSGVVNFRGVASVGKKSDSIFEIISRGYKKVTAADKLLEYKAK